MRASAASSARRAASACYRHVRSIPAPPSSSTISVTAPLLRLSAPRTRTRTTEPPPPSSTPTPTGSGGGELVRTATARWFSAAAAAREVRASWSEDRSDDDVGGESESGGGSSVPDDDDVPRLVRLSKRMSELDMCSRREADRLIAAGRVAVGGINVGTTLGIKIPYDECDITVVDEPGSDASSSSSSEENGSAAAASSAFDWSRMRGDVIVLHKPTGYVSGQPEFPDAQVPAVKLLTRSNLNLGREGGGSSEEDDEETRDMLQSGTFHFTRRFGMQQPLPERRGGREKKRKGDGALVRRRKKQSDRDGGEVEGDDEALLPQRPPPADEATLSGYVPAGRLDLASSGLLLFTRSGVFAKKLVAERSAVDKEYVARVTPVQGLTRREVRNGMTSLPKPNRNLRPLLRGGRTLHGDGDRDDGRPRPLKPLVEAEWVEAPDLRNVQAPPGVLRLVLREGRKHQVRRMCREILGLHCVALERTRVGKVTLDGLPEGRWRPLSEEEARDIFFAGREGDTSDGKGSSKK